MAIETMTKDPDAVLVYTWDWSAWLVGAATITTSTFAIDSNPDNALTLDQDAIVSGSTSTRVRISGGTAGKTYVVRNRVVTNESPTQTDDRSVRIRVRTT
jgi:hypothetical protein